MTVSWLLLGDAKERLRDLPDKSIHVCVTSPPYFNLRSYHTETWDGGDPVCDHMQKTPHQKQGIEHSNVKEQRVVYKTFHETCGKCGAVKTDRQIGHEKTPKEYVAALVEVFREVRRVLRDDGSCWIVIGDCYAQTGGKGVQGSTSQRLGRTNVREQEKSNSTKPPPGLKNKDLIGIPWMLAFALRDDGWYLREEIIWQKLSCLPESIKDRCTRQHETILHLTKSAHYYHDWFAISEPSEMKPQNRFTDGKGPKDVGYNPHRRATGMTDPGGIRNARSVWTINPEASKLKQFAMFPTRLASRIIHAITSDGGCCPTCGAQYERQIGTFEADEAWKKASGADSTGGYAGVAVKDYAAGGAQDASATKARILAGMRRKETIGWTAGCACPKDNRSPVPAFVLDPFSGAGTSMLCATRLGRDSFGIDLNPDYHVIAAARIADTTAKCLNGDGSRLSYLPGEVYQA